MPSQEQTTPSTLADVPGWFPGLDQALFTWFLENQAARGIEGDVVEITIPRLGTLRNEVVDEPRGPV